MKNFLRRGARLPKIRLNPVAASGRKRQLWRPWLTWVASALGVIIVFFGALAAYYYPKLKPAVDEARRAKVMAQQLSNNVSQQNFNAAKDNVTNIQHSID